MEKVMRDFFLFLSKNRPMTKLAKQYGFRFGAARFVAGATVEQAVESIQDLNEEGLCVTLDSLGEFIDNEEEASEMTELCIEAIRAIGNHQLDSQLSLKLTSLGLHLSKEVVLENMRRILDVANEQDVFVTIDMEDYECCGPTLEIFKTLKSEYENIGTVIQAYLYRTEGDMEDLNEYSANLRLVKGAYKESPEVAYPEKHQVDESFKNIIKTHLLNGNYTAIATHDDAMIQYTKELVEEHNIPRDQFEFQMLYGIRDDRQRELNNEGYKMRVYMPFGKDWYGYFMRRMAEKPANVAFVARGIINR